MSFLYYPLGAWWILSLTLSPWLAWEFRRRYVNSHPTLFAFALLFLPLLNFIVAFRLFTTYRPMVNILTKKRNAIALWLSFFLFATITSTTFPIILASALPLAYVDAKSAMIALKIAFIPLLIFSLFTISTALKLKRHKPPITS